MALLKATLVLGLALLLGSAQAFTYQNQTELLLQFKEQMLKRGPNWAAALKASAAVTAARSSQLRQQRAGLAGGTWEALAGAAPVRSCQATSPAMRPLPRPAPLQSWVCPTSPDGSCDPCGNMSWWGNFEHLGE